MSGHLSSGMATPRRSPAIYANPHDFIEFRVPIKAYIFNITAPLYKRGLSLREIEYKTGIPKTVVRTELVRNGISLRPTRTEMKSQGWRNVSKVGVKPPYGFCFFEGRITRHPKEYPVLHQIHKRWKSGDSLNSIATWLNGKRTPSPMNKKWSWNSVTNDVVVPLVTELTKTDAKIIVFRNTRGPAEGCAAYLANDLNLPPANSVLAALPQNGLSSASTKLRECLQGGTAFHSTNLSRQEKVAVETGFRIAHGEIRVLASTTTLAAGVNTPAATVILAESEFVGPEGRPFTIAEYKNMAGRAGRLGFNENGKSIILADHAMEREQLFTKYVLGKPEPIRSSFSSENADEWALRLLAQVKRIQRNDLIAMVCNTYGGYLATRANPNWKTNTERTLQGIVSEMIRLGLIDADSDSIQLSLLGRACGNASLPLSASMDLINILKTRINFPIDSLRLMTLLQILPTEVMGYVPIFKRGVKDTGWASLAARIYGADIVRILQFGAADNFEYEGRCKKTCIIWSWIGGVPLDEIETEFTKNFWNTVGVGDVIRIADMVRFHMPSAFEIVSILNPSAQLNRDFHDRLVKRLEFGIPDEFLPLLDLGLDLTRGDLLLLGKRGISTKAAFWKMTDADFRTCFGNRADEIIKLKPLE